MTGADDWSSQTPTLRIIQVERTTARLDELYCLRPLNRSLIEAI